MDSQLNRNQAVFSRCFTCRGINRHVTGYLLIAVLTLLASCGNQSSSGGNITITEMDYYSTASQNAVLTAMFNAYHKLHPNVTIKRTAVAYADLIRIANEGVIAHNLPDLIAMDNTTVVDFASMGALTQLDSYFPDQLNTTNYYAGPLQATLYQGKTYSLPVGSNDLALFYNIKDFQAAGLHPPATWGDFATDAQQLTTGDRFGIAFSAAGDETGTWQFEPFLWSNQGDLAHADAPQSVAALQMVANLVKSGAASKAVLTWEHDNIVEQFGKGHAAMMENGPWELAVLEQQYHMKFGTDFGVVPMPVPQAGEKPSVPLGGEVWCIPAGNDSATTRATIDLLKWLMEPAQLVQVDEGLGYIPALKSAAQLVLQSNSEFNVFAGELDTARPRTVQLGTKYPQVSQAIWTAEQAAISGSLSPQEALSQAQQQINSILQK